MLFTKKSTVADNHVQNIRTVILVESYNECSPCDKKNKSKNIILF